MGEGGGGPYFPLSPRNTWYSGYTQRQPWMAALPFWGSLTLYSRWSNERGLARLSKTLYYRGECKHFFRRQLHSKQMIAVGWELQNSSPTVCVWRWDQKNWPACPNKFEKIPINYFEAHLPTPRYGQYLTHLCAQPWAPIRAEQLSMAATAGVMCLCPYVRCWPYHGVGKCASKQLIGIV